MSVGEDSHLPAEAHQGLAGLGIPVALMRKSHITVASTIQVSPATTPSDARSRKITGDADVVSR